MLVQVTGRRARARRVVSLVAFGVAIALAGCSSGSSETDDDDVGSPGGTFVSPHADAAEESSAVEEAGEPYDAGEPRDASAVDAAAPHDARPADAQSLDASVHDSAPTGCVSEPIVGDAGAFNPTLPIVLPLAGGEAGSACGAGYVTAFYGACIGSNGSTAACAAWSQGGSGTPEEQTCASCIYGPNPGAGAFVYNIPGEPDEISSNDVACVLAADPSPAGVACAQALLDLNTCEVASCASCTSDGAGGGTDPDGTLIAACEMVADQGTCVAYDIAATAACADLDAGGAAAVCSVTSGSTFESDFIADAMVLCGSS